MRLMQNLGGAHQPGCLFCGPDSKSGVLFLEDPTWDLAFSELAESDLFAQNSKL